MTKKRASLIALSFFLPLLANPQTTYAEQSGRSWRPWQWDDVRPVPLNKKDHRKPIPVHLREATGFHRADALWKFSVGAGSPDLTANTTGKFLHASVLEIDRLRQTGQRRLPFVHVALKRLYHLKNKFIDMVAVGPTFNYAHNTLKGDVELFRIPALNNFRYDLTIDRANFLIEGDMYFRSKIAYVHPFVTLAFGMSSVKFDYDDYPKPGIAGGSIHLTPRYHGKLTANFGAGATLNITEHLGGSIRYIYQRVGNVKSRTNDTRGGLRMTRPLNVSANSQTLYFTINYVV